LVDALSDAGFSRIEVSSFVSPKAVPALRDAAEVFSGVRRRPGTVYVALVPNPKGAERALAAGVGEINHVASVSETHNRANMGMSPDDSIAGFSKIMETVKGSAVLTNA
ncbi:hydroxymethylglutaryl-CoA lyase, partial [Methylobacterium mesophilicum]